MTRSAFAGREADEAHAILEGDSDREEKMPFLA